MTAPLRVAFFTDSYYEANGVARTSRALETYAAERGWPLLCVHGGVHTRLVDDGSITRLELRRSRMAFALEHDLEFDLLLWRHYKRTAEVVRQFRPDVLHFTGPSDVGQMGALIGHRLSIPMVGSWHTNLHEYASRRVLKRLHWLSESSRLAVRFGIETYALAATIQFYKIPRILLAPNEDMLDLLSRKTGKPVHLMSRGVDAAMFTPSRRDRHDDVLHIGYVGRLSAEKSVRVLAEVEAALVANGESNYRFVIVGEGSEKEWLRRHLRRVEFCGVVEGEALAGVFANLDVFAFPSETETVGNVVLEAMASGVPVVAMHAADPNSSSSTTSRDCWRTMSAPSWTLPSRSAVTGRFGIG